MISAIFTPVCHPADNNNSHLAGHSPCSVFPGAVRLPLHRSRSIVGIKSGLFEVSGSKLGFNSSRSEEENCLSDRTFLVNSIQPRWNPTAEQVIKCKASSSTLKIPTMKIWSLMSIFWLDYGNKLAGGLKCCHTARQVQPSPSSPDWGCVPVN